MYILRKYKWAFFVFVCPALVLYTYFIIASIFQSAAFSFTEWDAISKPEFVGLENYAEMIQDEDFRIVMSNTFIGLLMSLIVQIFLGISIAYLIYKSRKGFRIYRSIAFLPVVLSAAAVAMMFTLFFNSQVGPINVILEAIGLESLTRNWLSDGNVVYWSVLTPMIYQFIGFYVIIFLAGLQSIPEEVLESSAIDGATPFQTFFRVVVPMQVDIILICTVLITSGLFKAFEHSYIMTWGGPGVRSAFLGVYMYITTFLDAQFGLGSAISMVILIFSLLFTIVFKSLNNRFDY